MKKQQLLQKQLKQQLQFQLESIAIPRQWRFLSQIPQNAQSKINKNYLKALFSVMLEPVILSQWQELDSEYLSLEFPPELECFKGHFPHQPIYPGVGQISFIQKFAKDDYLRKKIAKKGKHKGKGHYSGGTHGYDPSPKVTPDMGGIFLSFGPNVRRKGFIKTFENIHVYPYVMSLLGLDVKKKIDGKKEVLLRYIKN